MSGGFFLFLFKTRLKCFICLFYFEIQKLRLQSGLVRQVQIQFLWYGTRVGVNQDKSGAYLFLPGEEGAQVSPGPGLIPVP